MSTEPQPGASGRFGPSLGVGGLAALGLVAAGSLVDLGSALRPPLDPVDPAVLVEASRRIETAREPGSLVVHSPLFGMRELVGLGALPARPDLPSSESRRRRSVWLIDRDRAPMGGFANPVFEEEVGPGVVLRRFAPLDPGADRVVFDLVDLTGVTGRLKVGPRVRPCNRRRAEGGLQCAGAPDWMYLAEVQMTVGGRKQTCVWSHPPARGELEIEVPVTATVAAGHRLELEVRSALSDEAVQSTEGGASVHTKVRQGTRELGTVVRSNRKGWAKRRFVLEPGVPLVLGVSAAKDGRRHHCLDVRGLSVSVNAPTEAKDAP